MAEEAGEFYVRYYVGHKGKFGHEFLEFEFRPDGKLRYANNSNYKNDTIIRKELYLSQASLRECRRIIADSEIMKEDDNNWPEPDRVGRQELEIVMGNEHISFTTSKIGSLLDVQSSKDPEGLRIFYYLVQLPGYRGCLRLTFHNHERVVVTINCLILDSISAFVNTTTTILAMARREPVAHIFKRVIVTYGRRQSLKVDSTIESESHRWPHSAGCGCILEAIGRV